jgi:hypothetical protein
MNWQEWQQNADAKRKTKILTGVMGIALVVWMFPFGMGSLLKPHKTIANADSKAVIEKPAERSKAATHAAPVTPVAAGAPPTAPPAPSAGDTSIPGIANITGVWQGGGVVPKRNGACGLSVEIREVPQKPADSSKATTFQASTVLACPPFLPLWISAHKGKQPNPAALWLQAMSTTESVLTGSLVGDALVFSQVEATASADSQGCALESLEVRSFGNEHLLAKWREGKCEGGDVVLQKASK